MDVVIPALGESVTEATVGQWLKQVGDAVAADEPIVSLETDKVAVEVPAPAAGVLTEQLAKVGDTVEVGTLIARIREGAAADRASPDKPAGAASADPAGESAAAADAPAPAPAAPAASAVPAPEAADAGHAPAVSRLLEQYRLDPGSIAATGKDGRLTKADVLKAIEAGTARLLDAPASAPAPAPVSGPRERTEERIRMSRLRQTIARRLKEAQNTAAMLTTFNDVDMSAVMDARNRYRDSFEKKHGVRLGFMSFFVKACVLAARDVPSINARIDGEEIVFHDYMDVGVAV
ncbi:MAG: 2-oxo acid dehydrogenase subunit E2, partial [Sphingomonadaceae bacterium]